jgi:hypothetical protein
MLGDFLAHSPKYADTEKELDDIIQNAPRSRELTFSEILTRGKQRRDIISKSLIGANTAHSQRYEQKKNSEGAQQKGGTASLNKGRESSELKRRSVTFSMDIKSDSTVEKVINAAT